MSGPWARRARPGSPVTPDAGIRSPPRLHEKVRTAETHVAAVRFAVIVLNILVFLFLLPAAGTIPWLGYTISVVAFVYALAILVWRPQRRFAVMETSLFTSVSDATLITLWILATGGFDSPFYVLWYVSIAAVALRYDARTTVYTAVAYVVVYSVLLAALGEWRLENASALVVRNAYTVFVGVLGGWLAYETLAQSRAREEAHHVAETLDHEVRRQTAALVDREEQLKGSLHELEAANQRLKELDHLKTVFINTTAHELRTPLTSLKLQLHLLKTAKLGDLNERQRRATELIDRNMQRLALLVQDVSDVARLQSGHFEITPEPVELRGVLDEVMETMREAAHERGIETILVAPEELWVRGDANRLIQVLFNLLSNAVKFTPAGGRIIMASEPRGDDAFVAVSDTGPGITAAQMPLLFEPFSHLHDPMQQTQAGTGLGLFLSKGIVEHHGGRMWAESDGAGKGSRFCFTVPLHRRPARSATPEASVPRSG